MKNINPFLIAVITIVLLSLIAWIRELVFFKEKKDRHKRFLLRLGSKNFFCYNNRADCKDFIETMVIPQLPSKIEIIYLNGKIPESGYPQQDISYLLFQLKNYHRFPHLIKIRNGELIDISINNDVFNIIHHKMSIQSMLNKIVQFFVDN